MQISYDTHLKANLTLDGNGAVRAINYVDQYQELEHLRGREAAAAFVRAIAPRLNLVPDMLRHLDQPVSYLDPQPAGLEYRFGEEKPSFDTTTYAYAQTFLNVPVWGAGITTTLKQAPTRAIAATDSSAREVDAKMPSQHAIDRYGTLFAAGEKTDAPRVRGKATPPEAGADDSLLHRILGPDAMAAAGAANAAPRLIRGRFHVYRYAAASRFSDSPARAVRSGFDTEADASPALPHSERTLPLPPLNERIEDGRWYLVAELVIRLPHEGSRMNWRMLVEVETDSVLYLRALSSGVNGLVFTHDPITSTGTPTNTPNQGNAVLNPYRTDVELPNLNAPVNGTQALAGTWAALANTSAPNIAAPTQPAGANFAFNVRTNEFAAVNAYYHVDRFFRLVADLGFPLTGAGGYFDGTAFPVEVDHRGLGNTINAQCVGDGDGIDYTQYALADNSDTTNPIGIATDWRVVLHELGGHGILYDHVGSPNFGFAHSAGDSFAMILNDYLSEWHNGAPIDRFVLAPFVPAVARRSDRAVSAGWGWDGPNDDGGYRSEEILSTTLFRAYRSIGGDAASIAQRQFAARCMAYLILRAVGTLTPMSNPASPAGLLAALVTADAGDWTSERLAGGAYRKVLAWAFEKQNLNRGARPAVDVYVDDGRAGEYQFQPNHWSTTTVWNRRSPDGLQAHQEPALGVVNYAYVKIKNRGTAVANNVVVRGYHSRPAAGVLWPNDLQPLTTAHIAVGTVAPNNGEEKIVGPFQWTPITNAYGHDCMFMVVSADGDPSNVDNFTAGEVVEDWRLVPNDNNIGQRNVVTVPGGGGLAGLSAGLHGKGFWICNPLRASATVTVQVELPPMLAARDWRIGLREAGGEGVRLKSGEQRLVTFDVQPGAGFTRDEAGAAAERDIVVTARADGIVVGGMTYRIEPDLGMPFNAAASKEREQGCREKAQQLLDSLEIGAASVSRVRVRKVAIDVELDDGERG